MLPTLKSISLHKDILEREHFCRFLDCIAWWFLLHLLLLLFIFIFRLLRDLHSISFCSLKRLHIHDEEKDCTSHSVHSLQCIHEEEGQLYIQCLMCVCTLKQMQFECNRRLPSQKKKSEKKEGVFTRIVKWSVRWQTDSECLVSYIVFSLIVVFLFIFRLTWFPLQMSIIFFVDQRKLSHSFTTTLFLLSSHSLPDIDSDYCLFVTHASVIHCLFSQSIRLYVSIFPLQTLRSLCCYPSTLLAWHACQDAWLFKTIAIRE